MVHTKLEYSRDADFFCEKALRFRTHKRRIVYEDEEEHMDQSNDSTMDTSTEDRQMIIENKWRIQLAVSHRVYPLLFHLKWRHEINECTVHVDKFDSYWVEMKGLHASEFSAMINGLDELSQVKPFSFVFQMLYRQFSAQGFWSGNNEAKFLLKFVYLVAFYKAGWKFQQTSLEDFFAQQHDTINDIARELLPNSRDPMENYMDVLDQADQCKIVYAMLASTERFCKFDSLADKILQNEKWKRRNWPRELKEMLARKLVELTKAQQKLYMHSAREFNYRCLPSPASSLLTLRLVNSSFKAAVDKVIRKGYRFYRPTVATGECLRDGELIQLPVHDAPRLQPTHTFCSPRMLLRIESLVDPMTTNVYLHLERLDAGNGLNGEYMAITSEDVRFQIKGICSQPTYIINIKKLL